MSIAVKSIAELNLNSVLNVTLHFYNYTSPDDGNKTSYRNVVCYLNEYEGKFPKNTHQSKATHLSKI